MTTRKRTLEELDFVFSVPTRRHMAYQLRAWLPWFVKRYVLLQKRAELAPFYQLEGVRGGGVRRTGSSSG